MISESIISALLSRINTLGELSLKEAEVKLAEEFGFDDVELLDSSQRPIHGRTLLKKAIESAASAQIILPLHREVALQAMKSETDSPRSKSKIRIHDLAKELDLPSQAIIEKCNAEGILVKNYMHVVSDGLAAEIREWFREGARTTTLEESNRVDVQELRAPTKKKATLGGGLDFTQMEMTAIREMDLAEKRNGPIWAGFLLNTLLVRLGYGPQEARNFLQKFETAGLITLSKRPNPNAPDRPTTFVHLNRDHPSVRTVLESGSNGRASQFRPIKIQGGPISDDIVRDRR